MDFTGKQLLSRGAQGLTLGAIVAGTVAFVGADKSVAVSVDGTTEHVHTYGRTVADVLRAADVHVDSADKVSAPLDSTVRSGATVRVKLARSVTVDVDGTPRTVDTTADTVGDLADQLGVAGDAQLSLDKDVTLASSTKPLTVVTPKHVSLDLAGKRVDVTTTATDVADLLKEQGITPDRNDVVTPALNTVLTDGADVTWQRVTVKRTTTTRPVAAGSLTLRTEALDQGQHRIVRAGHNGTRTSVTEARYINGKLVSSELVSTRLSTAPVSKLVQIGTGEPKDDDSADSGSSDSSDSKQNDSKGSDAKKSDSGKAASAPSGSVSGVWQQLAKCESGGNWSTNTGNGYYGGLQFTASTWRAQGGTKYAALPHQATAAQQVAVASQLQKKAGWGQWPACTSKLGLR